jgi:hypothetical protein
LDGKSIVAITLLVKQLSSNECNKRDTHMHTQRMGKGKVFVLAQRQLCWFAHHVQHATIGVHKTCPFTKKS